MLADLHVIAERQAAGTATVTAVFLDPHLKQSTMAAVGTTCNSHTHDTDRYVICENFFYRAHQQGQNFSLICHSGKLSRERTV